MMIYLLVEKQSIVWVEGCGDTIIYKMHIKSKLGRVMARVSRGLKRIIEELIHGPEIEGFGRWFRIIVASALAIVGSHVIAFEFNLSDSMTYLIMLLLCVIVMTIVIIKPRLLLTVVCVTLLFIGVSFTTSSMNQDNVGENVWDSGLLGVGVSLVALAVAIYVLQAQVGRKRDAVNISGSERDVHNSEDGYVWVEESRKYRCEYCKDSGRCRYYKTLSGIKRHIAREHAQRRI
ncbi:MAG TPA: hypothetical protein VMW50_15005 [Dehalococcoidia bacterium]|nr:hypothetical protein [Dehalococcoidia bacterium]